MKKELEEELKKLFDWAEEDMVPRMRESAFCIATLDGRYRDLQLALQVGVALLLEKPLVILVPKGATIPPKVRLVADYLIEVETVAQGEEELKAAINDIVSKMRPVN